MLKVFLVEDESIMREGLRDGIPWEQYGYTFVGEASDGEMALPLIRKTRPDVLITDIKMPFMDGLQLSQIVSSELPNTKIIIISGYDDFEYARSAIEVGAMQYLLKPVTRSAMQKILMQISEKIESEREQSEYLDKFREEYHEYEQLAIRHFFEKAFDGTLSVKEMYDEAAKLSIDLNYPRFNIALVYIDENPDELLRYFMRFKEYLVFRWNIRTYCIMIFCDENNSSILTDRCIQNIVRICESYGEEFSWYVTSGEPVDRLSLLSECYTNVNKKFSYRFLLPKEHVLTDEVIEKAGNILPKDGDENDRENDPSGDTGRYSETIKRAISYIDNHFKDDNLSLNEVAEYSEVSPNYFSGIFSNETDMTFTEYVTKKRMDLAKDLLRNTNRHTGDIAAEVGYKDQHYFSVVFKKTQGMTPRDYRNQ